MVLVNGGFLHCTDIKKSCTFFSENKTKKKKKKIGKSNLKKSGERSRAILALLLQFYPRYQQVIQFYLRYQQVITMLPQVSAGYNNSTSSIQPGVICIRLIHNRKYTALHNPVRMFSFFFQILTELF